MRVIASIALTAAGAAGLLLSIRHASGVGVLVAGALLFGAWWNLERKEDGYV